MGQAKNRGSREQRIAEAVARQEALKPTEITCNDCRHVITAVHIHMQDTRNMPGVEMACAAICPQCQSTTWGFKGDPEAVQALAETISAEHEVTITEVQDYK